MRSVPAKSMPMAPVFDRESRSASSSRSRPAESIRAWAFRVRALALRESHSSSPRTRFRNDSWYEAWVASCSSFFSRYVL